MASVNKEALKKHRAECPSCHRKGLGYAMHPHAFGWKDYEKLECRYCNKRFKVLENWR